MLAWAPRNVATETYRADMDTRARIVVIDVETANGSRASMCQWAAARFGDDGQPVTVSRLINPGPKVWFAARNVAVHGIERAAVANAPVPPAVWPLVQSTFAWADLVVAHNLAFDASVMRAVADEWNLDLPPTPTACTVKLARKVWPDAPSHSLGNLTGWLGLPAFAHHDAEADVAATCRLMAAAADVLDCHVTDVFDAAGIQPRTAAA